MGVRSTENYESSRAVAKTNCVLIFRYTNIKIIYGVVSM